MKGLSEVRQVSKIHWGSVCVWPTLCTQGILSHKETQRQPMTTFVYGEWRCIIFIFRLLLVSQWGFEGIRELLSLSHDDPSGEIFCPIGRKKSNVKVNLDLWETQHTHVIMLIMTIHNFQFSFLHLKWERRKFSLQQYVIWVLCCCEMQSDYLDLVPKVWRRNKYSGLDILDKQSPSPPAHYPFLGSLLR